MPSPSHQTILERGIRTADDSLRLLPLLRDVGNRLLSGASRRSS